jgi:plasmid stabilization system protein ParE
MVLLRFTESAERPFGYRQFHCPGQPSQCGAVHRTARRALPIISGSSVARSRPRRLAPALRSLAYGRYVIFYRAVADGVAIVRALHGAREISGGRFGMNDSDAWIRRTSPAEVTRSRRSRRSPPAHPSFRAAIRPLTRPCRREPETDGIMVTDHARRPRRAAAARRLGNAAPDR